MSRPSSSDRAPGSGLGKEGCEGSSSADRASGSDPLRSSCTDPGLNPGRADLPPGRGRQGVVDAEGEVEVVVREVDKSCSGHAESTDCARPEGPFTTSPPRLRQRRVGGSGFLGREMAGAGHARRPDPRPSLASRDGGAEVRFATHLSHSWCTSRTILSQYNSVRLHTEPLAIRCS